MRHKILDLEARLAGAPALIPISEFLELAQMGRTRFYRLVNDGKLRGVKRAGHTFVPRDEALRFLTTLEPLVTPTMRRMSEHA